MQCMQGRISHHANMHLRIKIDSQVGYFWCDAFRSHIQYVAHELNALIRQGSQILGMLIGFSIPNICVSTKPP